MKALLMLLLSGKLLKALFSVGTMLLSIFAYGAQYGWRFGAGFVGLIFVHEMGHFLAARKLGLKTGLPIFIPFVGAFVELKDQPQDAETEAYVAMAGPLVGTAAALGCYFAGRHWDSSLMMALAYSGFFINLINLIPVSPLDGGRISAIVSPRIWLLGAPLLFGMFFWYPSPALVLLGIAALPQVARAWHHDPNASESLAYYNAPLETRIGYAVTYLGLCVFLAMMMLNWA